MGPLDRGHQGRQHRWEARRERRPDRAPPAGRESGQAKQPLALGYRLRVEQDYADPGADSATDPDLPDQGAAGSACRKRTLADAREAVESACPNARAADWVEQKPLAERPAVRIPVWAQLETVQGKCQEEAQLRAPPDGNEEEVLHWT